MVIGATADPELLQQRRVIDPIRIGFFSVETDAGKCGFLQLSGTLLLCSDDISSSLFAMDRSDGDYRFDALAG